jgi:hypothetical protein
MELEASSFKLHSGESVLRQRGSFHAVINDFEEEQQEQPEATDLGCLPRLSSWCCCEKEKAMS